MSDCSEHINPLNHTGTSQTQRLLPGLDAQKYPLVDEKDFADWIVFAGEFASFVKYYDTSNAAAGNWKVFFSNDISAQLGVIAIQNINRYRLEIKERLDFIRDDSNKNSINVIKLKLNELFSAILTLSKALDQSMEHLSSETSLKTTIQNQIQTKLAPALKKFIAYFLAADSASHHYLNHDFLSPWKILNTPLTDALQIISIDGLSDRWLFDTDKVNWNDYLTTILENDSIFKNPLTGFTEPYASIEHAVNHNLFTGIFDIFLSAYTKIVQDAETELLKTLENYNGHQAHYALFLSFLKLFRFSQDHINTLTKRHLDFYYKEVLRLQPRVAQANQVHVLAELAKQVDSYLLEQGILLKAGKDSLNKDVSYALNAQSIFNKAKITQLKNFYLGNTGDTIYYSGSSSVKQNNEGRAFASPVANSDDGLGAALSGANQEWHPYVHKIFKEAALESIAMPKAQVGFALASHYLYLTEGERKIFIRFVLDPLTSLDGKKIECWLTTEKKWYRVDNASFSSTGKKLSENNAACSELLLTIPGSAPSIVNYNASVHGGNFDCKLPVLKIYLSNSDDAAYEYELFKDTTITKIEIRVEVGMDGTYNQKGLKNLMLSNDFGVLDASKPFMPFGSQPNKDAGFVIGNKELFCKKNTTVQLNVEWADLPTLESSVQYETNNLSTNKPSAMPQFMEEGSWKSNAEDSVIADSVELFSGLTAGVQLFPAGQLIPQPALADYQDDYLAHNQSSVNGHMKLSLTSSFGHNQYIRDLSTFYVEMNPEITSKTITTPPVEPYTPKVKSLYASYSAYCINDVTNQSNFGTREVYFFHIYPFGEGEQHAALKSENEVYLLPQFKHNVDGSAIFHTGEFYIGIENLSPGEAVNILIQVLEGTTDPKLIKPEDHIHWSFLSNNEWIDFKTGEYSDNTLELVQSGIVSFAIPSSATTENSILPAGCIWIRAAVEEAAEAVCKVLAIEAQAATATFVNDNNAEDFLNSPLAAETISKLKYPDAAIKKIKQPFAAFGGRQKESDDHFHVRVSERLRHKGRAITVWDYEHLVLEAFPEIYKVKCLNHTRIEDGIYNETSPGYVSIITIPSLKNRNDANPLKPFTQQSTLTNIEKYLKKKTSCFVTLHARHPQFEEIRMEFSLKLHETYKDFNFYSNMLKEEITQFLSPWAYGKTNSIDFGGKVYKSVLINFIEERYYVDFITDVFMYVKVDELTSESSDRDEITASTARSILVSAPASRQVIHEITIEPGNGDESCPEI